jgi:urease alpha subunit
MLVSNATGNAFGIAATRCTDGRTHLRRVVVASEMNLAFRIAHKGAERFSPSRQGISRAGATRTALGESV